MIYIIVLFFFIVLLVKFPHFRNIALHPFSSTFYAIKDFINYIRYKKYNECNFFGEIIAFCSDNSQVFGCGKTLTAVNKVVSEYLRYNGRKVWNKIEKKFDTQHIRILTNVHFRTIRRFKLQIKPFRLFKEDEIEYEWLQSADQIGTFYKSLGPCDVGILLIDETSSLFNSRNFKDNFSPDQIKAMSTCRHTHFGMILTAPRFNQIDALMRQICSQVHMCSKFWRSQVVNVCSGYELEYMTNLQYIHSSLYCYFVKDWLYNAYDTDAQVEELDKQIKAGDRLSPEEILEAQGNDNGTFFNVGGTRKFKKVLKGM